MMCLALSRGSIIKDIEGEDQKEEEKREDCEICFEKVRELCESQKYRQRLEKPEERILPELQDCVSLLIRSTKSSCDLAVKHPLFWNELKKFEFIAHFSDYVLQFKEDTIIEASREFKKIDRSVCNWGSRIHPDLYFCLSQEGRYHYNRGSLRDLFRIIRNNGRHFQSLPERGRDYFKNDFLAYISYFLERFPYIVLFGYRVAEEYGLFSKKLFKDAFDQ